MITANALSHNGNALSLHAALASVSRNHRFPSCAIPASEVRASVTCVVVLVVLVYNTVTARP